MKNKRGITLIALVITIIILLILAGVTINLLLGENGILKNAKIAAEKYENKAREEENLLAQADDYITNNRETITISKEEYNRLTNNIEYSTTEQIIGKWIDGRPLYRKGYTNITITTSSGNVNQQVIDPNITTANGYQVNKFYGSFIDSSEKIINPLPFSVTIDDRVYTTTLGINDRGLVLSNTYNEFNGRKAIVFIEYTKMTD